MREDTPPTSPFQQRGSNDDDDDDELVYVGDNIDDVIEHLEGMPEPEDDFEDEDEEMENGDGNIQPERDDSIRTFSKHTNSLFCGSFNPEGSVAVTGGEDDKAFVWDVTSGEVVFEVNDHNDSVIAAEFSHDGSFLATGDMAGEVKVFKVDKNYKKVWEFSMGDMSWMKWHKKSNVLLAGSEVGEIYIWRIPSGDCKVLQGSGEKCEIAVFTHDDKRLAAGYSDGIFKLWDIKNQQILLNITPETSTDNQQNDGDSGGGDDDNTNAITTIDTDNENQLIIAGCANGTAKIIGNNGLIGVLSAQATSNGVFPLERVLIDCPALELKVAVTASLGGDVTIWDVSHQTVRNVCKDDDPKGITTMVWGKEQTVIGGCLGGAIKAWNVRNGEMKFTLLGHANNVHDLCYHEKKNLLLTVSEDKTAKIFALPI